MLSLSGAVRIDDLQACPLSVPLRDPFVIASGSVDTTRAVEVDLALTWRGRTARGLGEAACLPPVTREDQPDVLAAVNRARPALLGLPFAPDQLARTLRISLPDEPVTRAGIECAILDAVARIAGVAVRRLLGGDRGERTTTLETDITVPIGDPESMAQRARAWTARGFTALKIKVGKDVDADARALEAIARAAPGAKLRVDANGGYSAREALALAAACARHGIDVELWEQPCAVGDWDGLAQVTRAVNVPVVADESVRRREDVAEIVSRRCATGVNLKIVKFGSAVEAFEAGEDAQRAGLRVMVGGMVETRLGMTAAAHLACALGGADFIDLDTAWLLATDPYEDGYDAEGPRYTMPDVPGLGVRRRILL